MCVCIPHVNSLNVGLAAGLAGQCAFVRLTAAAPPASANCQPHHRC